MNSSLGLGFGDALHAMRTGFEFKLRIGTIADNPADNFLVAAMLAITGMQNFDFPALRFSKTRIHSKQVASEYCGLVATGARAYFKKQIVVIMRIVRYQVFSQGFFKLCKTRIEFLQFFLAQLADSSVFVRGHILCCGNVRDRFFVLVEIIDHGLCVRVFARQITKPVLVTNYIGVGEQTRDFFMAIDQRFQLVAY